MQNDRGPIGPNRRTATLAFALACAGVACQGSEPPPDIDTDIERVAQAIVTPSCPYREVVAFDPSKLCDDLPHSAAPAGIWRGTKVIEPVDVGSVRGAYCRYRWEPAQSVGPGPPAAAAVRIADRAGGLPAGGGERARCPRGSTRPRPGCRASSGCTSRRGWVSKLPAGQGYPVTVAVVDSAVHPYASPLLDNSGHGRTMGRLIDELACPTGQPCPVKIANHLALQEVDEASQVRSRRRRLLRHARAAGGGGPAGAGRLGGRGPVGAAQPHGGQPEHRLGAGAGHEPARRPRPDAARGPGVPGADPGLVPGRPGGGGGGQRGVHQHHRPHLPGRLGDAARAHRDRLPALRRRRLAVRGRPVGARSLPAAGARGVGAGPCRPAAGHRPSGVDPPAAGPRHVGHHQRSAPRRRSTRCCCRGRRCRPRSSPAPPRRCGATPRR